MEKNPVCVEKNPVKMEKTIAWIPTPTLNYEIIDICFKFSQWRCIKLYLNYERSCGDVHKHKRNAWHDEGSQLKGP